MTNNSTGGALIYLCAIFLSFVFLPLDLFSQEKPDTTTEKPLIEMVRESPDAIQYEWCYTYKLDINNP